MKTILILIIFSVSVKAQQTSDIIYDASTDIQIDAGANVCADAVYVNGSFSGGGTICGGPLPVTLSSFNAAASKNNVLLSWRTETELNNSGFDVERKLTLLNPPKGITEEWIKIAFIPGTGTTSEPKNYSFADKKLQTGSYKYRLKQIDYNGSYEYYALEGKVIISAPESFSVSQNYPNPSNPVSKIDFEIPAAGKVSLKVYDMLGQEVTVLVNEFREAGFYTADFDGSKLASGVYLYRLTAGEFNIVKKMILVK